MEFFIAVIVPLVVAIGLIEGYNLLFGDAAMKRRKNAADFEAGSEWGYRKKGGHYIHGDEPLICPLSGTEFYRWQWGEYKDEHGRPVWPKVEHLNTDDGYMRLVCVDCFLTKQDTIQAQNNAVSKRERAEWDALTIEEKIVQYDESGPCDTGPMRRLTLEGNYEIWNDGKWEIMKGSKNELTGSDWVFAAIKYGGKE